MYTWGLAKRGFLLRKDLVQRGSVTTRPHHFIGNRGLRTNSANLVQNNVLYKAKKKRSTWRFWFWIREIPKKITRLLDIQSPYKSPFTREVQPFLAISSHFQSFPTFIIHFQTFPPITTQFQPFPAFTVFNAISIHFQQFPVISRPGRSQGLLYKHLRHSLLN